MNKESNRKWVLHVSGSQERLYRCGHSGSFASLNLPDLGDVEFERDSFGARSVVSLPDGESVQVFREGDVLTRQSKGTFTAVPFTVLPIHSEKWKKMPILIFTTFLVGAGMLAMGNNAPQPASTTVVRPELNRVSEVAMENDDPASNSKPSHIEEQKVEEQEVKASVPVPKPVEKRVVPKEKAKPKRLRRSRKNVTNAGTERKSMSEKEREARKAFLRGDIPDARAINAEIEAETKKLSLKFKQFASEVDFAACRSFVANRQWQSAVVACQSATGRVRHLKAKQILRRLGQRARKLFLEGYVMEGTNPEAALERYKRAVETGSPGNAYVKKAAKKLKLLGSARQ